MRQWLKEVLTGAGLESIAADGALALGELVTNALKHAAGSRVEVDVVIEADRVEVGVTDLAATRPQLRKHESIGGADGGRGLVIVDAIADAWGVEQRGAGKRVWFSLSPTRSFAAPAVTLR